MMKWIYLENIKNSGWLISFLHDFNGFQNLSFLQNKHGQSLLEIDWGDPEGSFPIRMKAQFYSNMIPNSLD
jgi:hypothetical protein